jgi:hypothetical protein
MDITGTRNGIQVESLVHNELIIVEKGTAKF